MPPCPPFFMFCHPGFPFFVILNSVEGSRPKGCFLFVILNLFQDLFVFLFKRSTPRLIGGPFLLVQKVPQKRHPCSQIASQTPKLTFLGSCCTAGRELLPSVVKQRYPYRLILLLANAICSKG